MKELMMIAIGCAALAATADFAGNDRYRADNAATPPGKTVLFGDSITDGWPGQRAEFFKSHPELVGRGIGGQTSVQMLCRFRSDVIDLRPARVAILAGTNDMAENMGAIRPEDALANVKSMCELAKLHGIKVYLCSVLPSSRFGWKTSIVDAADRIRNFNRLLKQYADEEKIEWIDYYSRLADDKGGMGANSDDGVHPNQTGYAVMEEVLLKALGSK
jgi:lysophospholipase L1-like esterase